MTVWAPYKGTRNRWQMEHSNASLGAIQGHKEQMVDGASNDSLGTIQGHKEDMVDGAQL